MAKVTSIIPFAIFLVGYSLCAGAYLEDFGKNREELLWTFNVFVLTLFQL
jgi:hypothetical protein